MIPILLILLASQTALASEDGILERWKQRRATAAVVKEQKAAETAKELERRFRQRFRQKQYSKLVDGASGFLKKGAFKWVFMGAAAGGGVFWWFCHDGCFLLPACKDCKEICQASERQNQIVIIK